MTIKSEDDLFRSHGEGPVHPRLQRWRSLASAGHAFELSILRKWDGLTFAPARMFVTFRQRPEDPGTQDEVLWEEELNQGLVELGVPAKDRDTEVVRYALAFRSAFEPVSLRHGQDYVRCVLVEYLRDEDFFARDPILREKLDQIRVERPYRGGQHAQVVEAVETILKTKAQELEGKLHYPREVAVDILRRALAQYLDEIFHLTARRFWFPK